LLPGAEPGAINEADPELLKDNKLPAQRVAPQL
jgi:hypothetical protein